MTIFKTFIFKGWQEDFNDRVVVEKKTKTKFGSSEQQQNRMVFL